MREKLAVIGERVQQITFEQHHKFFFYFNPTINFLPQ